MKPSSDSTSREKKWSAMQNENIPEKKSRIYHVRRRAKNVARNELLLLLED